VSGQASNNVYPLKSSNFEQEKLDNPSPFSHLRYQESLEQINLWNVSNSISIPMSQNNSLIINGKRSTAIEHGRNITGMFNLNQNN